MTWLGVSPAVACPLGPAAVRPRVGEREREASKVMENAVSASPIQGPLSKEPLSKWWLQPETG